MTKLSDIELQFPAWCQTTVNPGSMVHILQPILHGGVSDQARGVPALATGVHPLHYDEDPAGLGGLPCSR